MVTPKDTFKGSHVVARPSTEEEGLVIEIMGRFSMGAHQEFIRAFEQQGRHYKRYAVDMERCTSIDSSGLGMLLQMRDFANLQKGALLITNCSPKVIDVLRLSGFDEIFHIE